MPHSSSLADDPGAVAEQMHPRPHLVRPDWLSLDGPWDFALDADDRGERERWFERREPWPARIVVPFPWESPRSGVGGRVPDRYVRGGTIAAGPAGGVGWYRRRVMVPPGWHGQRIWLVVGAAYWHSRIWIDGWLAAEHDGGYDPFEADVTDLAVDASDFWVVIRVWAPEDTDEYPHGKNTRHWYSRASGIWQTVFVEPRPATYLETWRVLPDLASGALHVRARVCAGTADAATLRLEVTLRGRAVAAEVERVELPLGVSSHGLVARLTSVPEAWSPETPVLYEVRVTVVPDGERPDQVATTFGFRTIGFAPIRDEGPRWLHLNGVPLYVRGVMSQGYHPDGLLTYPDEATIVQDLAEARRLGFNLVRLHVKMEDPRVLAWADRLGILIWCEVPDILTPADAAKERWEKTWRAMIERDAGHPSIVLWCMFIESWGLGINQFGFGGAERRFADDPAMQAWVSAMYALGRSLDPTRPIIENSTSEADHTVAEVNDIHLFPTGYGELQASAAATLDAYVANAYPGSRDNFAPGHVQDVQPLMVTSMAGWSSVDGVETSWPLLALVNEVRARESIAGYGWVQLYDVEWELTGLETYDRRQKAFGYEVARLNSDDVLVVRGPLARAVDRGATVAIEVALAHASGRVTGDVHVVAWLEGVDGAWRRVLTPTRSISPTVSVDRLGVIPLGTVALTAPKVAFCGRIHIAVIATEARVVATGSVLLATDSDADDPDTIVGLPLAAWADTTADLEVITIDGVPQRIAGTRLECSFRLGSDAAGASGEGLVFEAEGAILDPGVPGQSLRHRRRFDVRLEIDDEPVIVLRLPVMGANTAGCLSILTPAGLGSYGGHIRAVLQGVSRGKGAHRLTLTLDPKSSARRIVLFGPRLGRAPVGPRICIRRSRSSKPPRLLGSHSSRRGR